MIEAKISQLKDKLSAFVARARAGESVIIFDRDTAVAKLGPLDEAHSLVVREATVEPAALRRISAVRLKTNKPVDVVALLRVDRDE